MFCKRLRCSFIAWLTGREIFSQAIYGLAEIPAHVQRWPARLVEKIREAVSHLTGGVRKRPEERRSPVQAADPETEAKFRRIVEINVIGTDLVTRRALARMKAGAAIINTASIWGRVAEAEFDAYVASKHAIIGLTKTWAKELGPRGIRVNAICPGWVRTEASMRSLATMSERKGIAEDTLLAAITGNQALPGLMEPADMAEAYLFLASPAACNITGQSLGVDRGEVPW